MLPERCLPLDEDRCPVGDQMLGELYRASAHGLAALIATLTPTARAMLAVYCYRRAHLAAISLAVAAACAENDLVRWGGNVGAALFQRSRQTPETPAPDAPLYARRKITLATKPIGRRTVFKDIEDDDHDTKQQDSGVRELEARDREAQDQAAELCPV